jgi:glutaredoxin
LREGREARGEGTSMSVVRVVMYTREGCHLCDDALRMLEALRKCYDVELETVDVDSAPELVQLHGERVPVIVVNGKERFWGRINRVLLERQLRADS